MKAITKETIRKEQKVMERQFQELKDIIQKQSQPQKAFIKKNEALLFDAAISIDNQVTCAR